MQRTIDAAVLGFAFAEGAAAMRTTAVQRVKLPAEVEQRQFTIAHAYTQSAIRRNLVHFGNGNKFAHGHPSECWRRSDPPRTAPRRGTGRARRQVRSLSGRESTELCARNALLNWDWLVAQAFQPAGSGDFRVASLWSTGLESPVNRQVGKPALHSGSWAGCRARFGISVSIGWPKNSDHCDAGAVPSPTGGFFFHGISGNFVGTLTFGGAGCAICSSESAGGSWPGGAMFPFHEAMRACKPWCSAVFLSPAFI